MLAAPIGEWQNGTMSLRIYNQKRKFKNTPEPKGVAQKKSHRGNLKFVVQMHDASRLHFDFRLEFDGVFKSWAVPKGPSLNPQDQRLAVFVEDHPIAYGSFEGLIPKGNYGAGTVLLWDEGTYVERGSEDRAQSEVAMKKAFAKGHITFVVTGTKLNGEFALIKLKKDKGQKAWLLVKKRDEYSSVKRTSLLDNRSVKSGRTIAEIAAASAAEGKVWLPKKGLQKKIAPSRIKQKKPILLKRSTVPQKMDLSPPIDKQPMPRKLKPMIPTISRTAPSGKNWFYEIQPKGLRAVAEVEGQRVHLYSRSGLPFEKKFPEVLSNLSELGIHAVLDGVVTTSRGHSVYVVFDLLYLNGHDLRKTPLRERIEFLDSVKFSGAWVRRLTPLTLDSKNSGPMMARNLDSVFQSGISKDWLTFPASVAPLQSNGITRPFVSKKTPSKAKTSPPAPQFQLEEPRLTNLDKIYFPEDGISKGDLIAYYRNVASHILPYLVDRPESLNRQPNGIAAPGFYQKDMTGHLPRWLKTERVFSESSDKTIDYLVCQDERSLLYIVNLGCIEIHPWFSRVGNLNSPDFLVIDLDPDDNPFDHVIEVALEFHKLMKQIGAIHFCKTSGATGLHIGVPLQARWSFDEARDLAESLCRVVARKFPTTTSLERSPSRRRGKIYLDYLQNRRGQTLAAPYCVRPRNGAPVSMPLPWLDLHPGLKPAQFHIHNVPGLIQKRKDPWLGVLGPAIDLEVCRRKVQKLLGR